MPKISTQTIEEIKIRAKLKEVIEESGVSLKPTGVSYKAEHAMCPGAESGKAGKMTITPRKNIAKCWTCGKAYTNAISYCMDYYDYSFVNAVKYLANMYSIEIQYDK